MRESQWKKPDKVSSKPKSGRQEREAGGERETGAEKQRDGESALESDIFLYHPAPRVASDRVGLTFCLSEGLRHLFGGHPIQHACCDFCGLDLKYAG